MKIFLVGLPGAGKTTLGRKLASQLKYDFTDLDQMIEQISNDKIPEIFDQYGEDHFRALERDALKEVVNGDHNVVVATGGGAPCFHDGMDRMLKNGKTIFLDTPITEIIKRLEGQEQRPLLRGKNLDKNLSELFRVRYPIYTKADFHIDGCNLDLNTIASLFKN